MFNHWTGEINLSKKKKEQKKSKTEKISEQKAFDFYFVAGYTSGGIPYGIKMEDAKDRGLLEEDKKYLKAVEEDYPF